MKFKGPNAALAQEKFELNFKRLLHSSWMFASTSLTQLHFIFLLRNELDETGQKNPLKLSILNQYVNGYS